MLLIGQGPLFNEIKEKVIFLGIEKNVILLGQKSNINEYYQAMDAFVLPSLYEGMPVVGIEAQAAGLPCYFSKNMTKDAKILDTTVFLDINEGANAWATRILNDIGIERKNTIKSMNKYDIEEIANVLCDYYTKLNIANKG